MKNDSAESRVKLLESRIARLESKAKLPEPGVEKTRPRVIDYLDRGFTEADLGEPSTDRTQY